MSVGLNAFSDELTRLTKIAGPLKWVASKAAKKPLHTLGALAVLLPAAAAGYQGYKRGRKAGKPARYLHASRRGPSRAFYVNWNKQMGRKKMKPHQRRKLHEHELSEKALKG